MLCSTHCKYSHGLYSLSFLVCLGAENLWANTPAPQIYSLVYSWGKRKRKLIQQVYPCMFQLFLCKGVKCKGLTISCRYFV